MHLESLVKRIDRTAKRTGINYLCHCPRRDLHRSGDKTPSLSIHSVTGNFHCFGCGWHGGLKALIRFTGIGSVSAQMTELPHPDTNPIEIPNTCHRLTGYFNGQLLWTRRSEYLESRQVTLEAANWFDLHVWIQPGSRYNQGIVFPVDYENYGFWGIRFVDGLKPKYIYPQCNKSCGLYRAFMYPLPYVVLCEGIFDAIRIWQSGIQQVSPLFGTELSQEQLVCLAKANKRVLVVLDRDTHRTEKEQKLVRSVGMYCDYRLIRIQSKDPGEMHPEVIYDLLAPHI